MHFRLRIIDSYIGKEILFTWIASMFVLLLVLMSAEIARQLSWLAEGRIQSDSLLPLLAISLIKNFIQLMPLSCLLSILLAFGRLYKDSEMAAVMSSGMGPVSWYRPVLMITVPACLLMLLMTLFVVPELNFAKTRIIDEAQSQKDLSSVMAGRFNPSQSGDAVFFLESQNAVANEASGIFFRQVDDGVDILDVAASASNVSDENGDTFLVMHDGRQYIGTAGSNEYRIIEYDEYGVRLASSSQAPMRNLKSIPTMTLLQAQTPAYQAELHWRITVPIAMFVLAMIAVPLSYTGPRSGRYAKLAVALFIYIVYANLLGISKQWIAAETIPVWIGGWWVHLIALGLLLWLVWQRGYLTRVRKTVTI